MTLSAIIPIPMSAITAIVSKNHHNHHFSEFFAKIVVFFIKEEDL
jgi:hypothetical protein